MEQDPRLIYGIMDYRLAKSALAQFKADSTEMSEAQVAMIQRLTDSLKEHGHG